MTKSLADRIANSEAMESVSQTTEMPNGDMNIPPHLISRIEVIPVTTGNSKIEQVKPFAISRLVQIPVEDLLEAGIPSSIATELKPEHMRQVHRLVKNALTKDWNDSRKQPKPKTEIVEEPKPTVEMKTMQKDQATIIAEQGNDIAELRDMMKSILGLVKADQTAGLNFTEIPVPATEPSVSIPKVQDTPTTPAGALVAPDVFYRFAINQLKNKAGKDGKRYDGVHAVYSGLNAEVRKYYGKDTDVVALTAMLEKQGKIVTRMVKGGPIVFLPEDFKKGSSSGLDISNLK